MGDSRLLSEAATATLDEAVQLHKPVALYAMFSGGHDSLVTAHITAQHPAFKAAVHINTGIGIEETREFVRETCRREGWPLIELHPPAASYRELVLKHGFPGYGAHSFMYRYLKERAIRQLVRETKVGHSRMARVALSTGVRRQESVRRMGSVEPIAKDGAWVWVAPLHDWNGIQIREYMAEVGLPSNPVVDLLHISGECLCGSFARPHELAEIADWFPAAALEIYALEAEVVSRGEKRLRPWGWTNDKSGRRLCQQCAARTDEPELPFEATA